MGLATALSWPEGREQPDRLCARAPRQGGSLWSRVPAGPAVPLAGPFLPTGTTRCGRVVAETHEETLSSPWPARSPVRLNRALRRFLASSRRPLVKRAVDSARGPAVGVRCKSGGLCGQRFCSGTNVQLTSDLMRARYRESLKQEKLITPSTVNRYDFTGFTWFSRRPQKGSRLRLVLAQNHFSREELQLRRTRGGRVGQGRPRCSHHRLSRRPTRQHAGDTDREVGNQK